MASSSKVQQEEQRELCQAALYPAIISGNGDRRSADPAGKFATKTGTRFPRVERVAELQIENQQSCFH